MQTKLDGLILSKTPYQERHLVGKLLLRSGKRVSVMFYGGQGGGKKMKVSGLELGHLIKLELAQGKRNQEMYSCKEWSVGWAHENIRTQHIAFWTMCFFLELVQLLSPEDGLHDSHRESDVSGRGLYAVLSNALAHMDKSLSDNEFDHLTEIMIFLGKILIEQGIFPERTHCALSGEEIRSGEALVLFSERGAFAKSHYAGSDQMSGSELWNLLGVIANQKYHQIKVLNVSGAGVIHAVLDYLCYQLQFQKKQFKTLPLLL
jgi:recombinational DNA repair protein (RecF pathway)